MKFKTLIEIAVLATFLTINPFTVKADSTPINDLTYDSAGVTRELKGDTIYTTDYLNVRRQPDVNSERVATLAPNSKVTRIASVGNWDTILVAGIEYYICNDYITMAKPAGEIVDIQQIEPVDLDYIQKCGLSKPIGEYAGNYSLTAYCSCSICCGSWGGTTTASGTTPTAGRTVACNSLLFGTKVFINGRIYTVEDTGGMANNVIDIYMSDHNSALNFGRRNADVYIVK